jgi:hypothetical protein
LSSQTFKSHIEIAYKFFSIENINKNFFDLLIGFTNDIENHPLSIGLTVQFPTPEFSLVAKGDMLASSQLCPANTTEPEAKGLEAAQLFGGWS